MITVFERSPLLDSKVDLNVVYAQVHTRSTTDILVLVEVGIREFREELASYLQESELPVAHYVPPRLGRLLHSGASYAERSRPCGPLKKRPTSRPQEMLAHVRHQKGQKRG
jgi:hypothetical protein